MSGLGSPLLHSDRPILRVPLLGGCFNAGGPLVDTQRIAHDKRLRSALSHSSDHIPIEPSFLGSDSIDQDPGLCSRQKDPACIFGSSPRDRCLPIIRDHHADDMQVVCPVESRKLIWPFPALLDLVPPLDRGPCLPSSDDEGSVHLMAWFVSVLFSLLALVFDDNFSSAPSFSTLPSPL